MLLPIGPTAEQRPQALAESGDSGPAVHPSPHTSRRGKLGEVMERTTWHTASISQKFKGHEYEFQH
jgi:hypothetical protein